MPNGIVFYVGASLANISLLQVSGSAAKLARDKACHHFTLLLSVDRNRLATCLRPNPHVSPGNRDVEGVMSYLIH